MTRGRWREPSRRGGRSRSLEEILARKRELVERATDQRAALADAAVGLAPAFAVGDRAIGAGRFLASRPLLLVAAGVLLLALWPRAILGLAVRGFALWNGAWAVRRLMS